MKVPAKAMLVSCPRPLLWLVLVGFCSGGADPMRGGGNPTPATPRRRLPGLLCAAIVPRAASNFRRSFWHCSGEVNGGGAGAAPRGLATAVDVDTNGGGGGGGGAAPRGAGRGGVGDDLEGGDAFAAAMRRCLAAT